MPVNATNWVTGQPVSAKKLNEDLYTYMPGNSYTPNGIQWHTQKTTLLEYVAHVGAATQPASAAGSFSPVVASGISTVWLNVWDSSAYWGPGSDAPGSPTGGSQGFFTGSVLGAGGFPDTTRVGNGWYWIGGHVNMAGVASGNGNTTVGAGVSFVQGTTPSPLCSAQLASFTSHNTAFVLDLFHADNGTTDNYAVGGYEATSSGTTATNLLPSTAKNDWAGECTRLNVWWASIDTLAQLNSEYVPHNTYGSIYGGLTVSGGPTPPPAFTGASAITSSVLNSDVVNTLNFLNYPPLLRRSTQLNQSIPASTVTAITIGSGTAQNPQVDTYSGLSVNTYTVPVSGVYLVHGAVSWVADSTASYQRQTGVQINGSLNLWGPSYQSVASTSAGCVNISTVTRLLDLTAGDTVTLVALHNKATAASTSNSSTTPCRLLLQWMGALGVPSTLWNSPDPSYRWQAGTPGSQLTSLFNTYLTNDLGFLVNRPYLLTYQTTASPTGVAGGTVGTYVMNNATGRVHASAGDNYSGWTSGASNLYTANRAGWYLVVAEYTVASATADYVILALVNAPGTGHQTTPYFWGQQINSADASATQKAGATYCNLHYLRAGDTIQPCAQVTPASGTWSAATVTGQESSFSLIWVSQ